MVLPAPDLDPVLTDLQRRGYETTRLDGATTPPAVATGGDPPEAVTDPDTADRPLDALDAPFLLRADPPEGGRAFYSIPDRIRLTDGTLAAVAARDPTWREADAAGGVTGDERALLLESDGETVAALESVDALTCPGPDPNAFPYRYERGGEGRFHVYGRDREVGTFTGFAAMESRGFYPVDLPLVPEHHLRENAHLARRWLVATVEDGSVAYTTA
ncbi:MAG: hypothetical protein V5A44_00310 [Haloarculaceae archaeon]